MLVGPRRVLLMDEISTGLDSATLFTTIQALAMVTHGLDLTSLVALLQPPPEVYDLFDDLLLMSQDGRVLYHGPVEGAVPFFATLGLR
jgi:ABC-type multidrug transport system ATPase subunit